VKKGLLLKHSTPSCQSVRQSGGCFRYFTNRIDSGKAVVIFSTPSAHSPASSSFDPAEVYLSKFGKLGKHGKLGKLGTLSDSSPLNPKP
jgi:peroxiredoxin